jgi:hypothetical protein
MACMALLAAFVRTAGVDIRFLPSCNSLLSTRCGVTLVGLRCTLRSAQGDTTVYILSASLDA